MKKLNILKSSEKVNSNEFEKNQDTIWCCERHKHKHQGMCETQPIK